MSVTDVKKHITEITAEYRPYWQPVFDTLPNPNPQFSAKLCYMGKEFSAGGTTREECVRFFPNELSNENGIYMELYNWDQGHYEDGYRVLYHLPHDPHWRSNDNFKEITTTATGARLTTPTYAVKLQDLVLVNKTSKKALAPDLTKKSEKTDQAPPEQIQLQLDGFDESAFADTFEEMADNHYTQMTIRDLYCMLQNVPLSNKGWLNKLIENGKQWQKK